MRAIVETHDVFDATGIVVDPLPKVGENGNGEQRSGQQGDTDGRQQTQTARLTSDSAAPSFLHRHFRIAHDPPPEIIHQLLDMNCSRRKRRLLHLNNETLRRCVSRALRVVSTFDDNRYASAHMETIPLTKIQPLPDDNIGYKN